MPSKDSLCYSCKNLVVSDLHGPYCHIDDHESEAFENCEDFEDEQEIKVLQRSW